MLVPSHNRKIATSRFLGTPLYCTYANVDPRLGVLDREGNARKVVNCSCVVVRDWGEESQERSILLNYFQTEQ